MTLKEQRQEIMQEARAFKAVLDFTVLNVATELFYQEWKLLKLVEFCQTGKWPED